MMKQEEENASMSAPAESRAAPPPMLGYATPQKDRRPQSTFGQFSIVFGVFAIFIMLVAIAFSGTFASREAGAVLGILCLLLLVSSVVCGTIGVCQRSHKRTAAIIGISISGFFLLSWCVLMGVGM